MKKYEEEFKKEAVKLAREIGINKAAEQLGVAKSTMSTWCSKPASDNNSNDAPLTPREIQLMKEIRGLKKSNAILKDALGFFPQSQKR